MGIIHKFCLIALILFNFQRNYYYTNFEIESKSLNLSLSSKDIILNSDSIINIDYIQSLSDSSILITGNLYNSLIKIEEINQWYLSKYTEIYPSNDYDEFVEICKNELELYYVGSLNLSNGFNSYLIKSTLITDNIYYNLTNCFLINEVNCKVHSITKFIGYLMMDGESNHLYTRVESKGFKILNTFDVHNSSTTKVNLEFNYDQLGFLKEKK